MVLVVRVVKEDIIRMEVICVSSVLKAVRVVLLVILVLLVKLEDIK